MKKELSLALLSISLALSSLPGTSLAQQPPAGTPPPGVTAQSSLFSDADISIIRQCVADQDVLCLRTLLASNPAFVECASPASAPLYAEWEVNLCRVLSSFWVASADIDGNDLWGEVTTALFPTIYV